MYDELVKRLREAAEYEPCIMDREDAIKAADAIEELQGRAKVLEKVADKWYEAVPKWIPVTERLPEKTEEYLVVIETDIDGAIWTTVKTSLYLDGKGFWDEGIHERVTHWMPLPEPPKEERR